MSAATKQHPRHLDLILKQIDTLPTLPGVATKLLSITSDDDSSAQEVIEVIRADPSITAKVLSMCRKSEMGVKTETLTIDKAVMFLGFNAIRHAILSIKVFEVFGPSEPDENGVAADSARYEELALAGRGNFDLKEFWRHCLSVAIAAEQIAAKHPELRDLSASEAFVCGLLHDIGKPALHHVLPKAYKRVLELVDVNQGGISEYEKRIVGIDHHSAGKRLAEQWKLPGLLQDCIWLHGTPYQALPNLPHRRMIGLVSLADLITRRQHIGYSGNYSMNEDPDVLIDMLELKKERVTEVAENLLPEVLDRAHELGLDDKPSPELFIQCIQHANEMLGKLNAKMEERGKHSEQMLFVMQAVESFQKAQVQVEGIDATLGAIAISSTEIFGVSYRVIVVQASPGDAWQIYHINEKGETIGSQALEPDEVKGDLSEFNVVTKAPVPLKQVSPWLAKSLPDLVTLDLHAMTLHDGQVMRGLILMEKTKEVQQSDTWQFAGEILSPLVTSWASAIAMVFREESLRYMGEELVEVNRTMSEMQEKMLQQESLAHLGEMAAGAAHEMNNPLAVISGRAQLLTMALAVGTDEHQAAKAIVDQSDRLSRLITALSDYADAPEPQFEPTDLQALLNDAVHRGNREAQQNQSRSRHRPVSLQMQGEIPNGFVDPLQVRDVISELLSNALASNPKNGVVVLARHVKLENKLLITISDDGRGMDAYTLEHAFDPFFSNHPAGRKVGMGLPLARRLVLGMGGTLDLRSTDGQGTVATLSFPLQSRG